MDCPVDTCSKSWLISIEDTFGRVCIIMRRILSLARLTILAQTQERLLNRLSIFAQQLSCVVAHMTFIVKPTKIVVISAWYRC